MRSNEKQECLKRTFEEIHIKSDSSNMVLVFSVYLTMKL